MWRAPRKRKRGRKRAERPDNEMRRKLRPQAKDEPEDEPEQTTGEEEGFELDDRGPPGCALFVLDRKPWRVAMAFHGFMTWMAMRHPLLLLTFEWSLHRWPVNWLQML
jgi:hypothetical protein